MAKVRVDRTPTNTDKHSTCPCHAHRGAHECILDSTCRELIGAQPFNDNVDLVYFSRKYDLLNLIRSARSPYQLRCRRVHGSSRTCGVDRFSNARKASSAQWRRQLDEIVSEPGAWPPHAPTRSIAGHRHRDMPTRPLMTHWRVRSTRTRTRLGDGRAHYERATSWCRRDL